MNSIEIINSVESDLIIETPRFDLDIIGGSKNFLTNKDFGDISSLLFIPINEEYSFGKVNRKLLTWNNTTKESNNLLTLNVYSRSGNKWEVKIDSKSIPNELLPQESGTIEIPVVFSNKYKLSDGDLVLFKINKLVIRGFRDPAGTTGIESILIIARNLIRLVGNVVSVTYLRPTNCTRYSSFNKY